jgi:hypothetical protein
VWWSSGANGEDSLMVRQGAGRGGGMSFQVQIKQMPGYLAARFTGIGLLRDVSRQFELIAERCKLTNSDKLLIDTMGFEAEISFMDRFYLEERSEIFTRYGVKVAFVGRPEQFYPPQYKFALYAAQNRGIDVWTFTDFKEAEEWLLK